MPEILEETASSMLWDRKKSPATFFPIGEITQSLNG